MLTQMVNYANIALIINLIVSISMVLYSKQSKPWMLFPVTMLVLSILQNLLSIPLHLTWPSLINYSILITTSLFGGNLILEFNQLYLENIVLQQEKNIDPLTGTMNRNIIKDIRPEIHDFVVMLDMNRFKEINDTFGHAMGDELLVQFSHILRMNLRQNDLIIRYGGDEFLLVFSHIERSNNGYQEVVQILDRVQTQYARLHPEINLGFSYGIAIIQSGISSSLELADRRMYQMKENIQPIQQV